MTTPSAPSVTRMFVPDPAAAGKLPPRAWYALPGAGTLLGAILGGLEVTVPVVPGLGFGGTSGGGLCALVLGTGKSPSEAGDILEDLLQTPGLLDRRGGVLGGLLGDLFDDKPGLYRGDKIAGLLRDVLGAQTRLGDLKLPTRVCAWDAWTRKPVVFCSQAHPDVLAWKAGRATMSIQGLFDLMQVRENNARTYGDGGLVVNVPHGLWDDKVAPTLGVRFARQQSTFDVQELIDAGGGQLGNVRPVRTWREMVPAVADTALQLASASWPSRKGSRPGGFLELVIDSAEDGLDFSLTPKQVLKRREDGRSAGVRALRDWCR